MSKNKHVCKKFGVIVADKDRQFVISNIPTKPFKPSETSFVKIKSMNVCEDCGKAEIYIDMKGFQKEEI